MKNQKIFSILITAGALLFLAAQSGKAQVLLSHYYYQPSASGATRSPVRSSGSGHFVKLDGPADIGPAIRNTTQAVQTQESTTIPGSPNVTYVLAYVTVTGGLQGDVNVYADASGVFPIQVPVDVPDVANPKIYVNAYYFETASCPPGEICGCPAGQVCSTGASIDEFSDSTNSLLQDPFVTVYVPATSTTQPPTGAGTPTGNANTFGSVDTTKQSVRINADLNTASGGTFDRWVTLPGGNANGLDLTVNAETSDIALAHYRGTCPAGYTWALSSTISECSKVACGTGKVYDPSTGKCVDQCPAKCAHGCIVTLKGIETPFCKP